MLTQGDKAPYFKLLNQDGCSRELSDFLGHTMIIYFYPKDDTPGCTKEAIGFSESIEAFQKKNTIILGVSKDSVELHKRFQEKHTILFDLLSDTAGNMCHDYGVWQEKKNYGKTYMGIVRSTFLIDETGCIRKIWRNVKVKGHVEAVCNDY